MEVELKLKAIAAIALALSLGLGGPPASAKIYGNARFGFFVDVPAVFSVADPDPENGDGRRFHTPDNSAELTASGGWIMADDFAGEVANEKELMVKDGWKITYESKVTKSVVSYSGIKSGRIFYTRMITSCGGKAHASYWLEYPATAKLKYEELIKGLNATLKAGVGSCG
jgi:hypothetical protein